MSQFFEAYQKWPPQNQMLFAIAAMVVGAVMLFIIGWWLTLLLREIVHYSAVWVRGWPKDEASVVHTPSANAEDMATVRASLEEVRRPILVEPSVEPSTPGGLPGVVPNWQAAEPTTPQGAGLPNVGKPDDGGAVEGAPVK